MKTKGENTRERIIRLAAPVFNTYGYAGTSLSKIMELTGLEKGGIYNHFRDKNELALAAFDYAISLTVERFRKIFADRKHAVDRLYAMLDYYRELARGELLEGGCPVLNTAIDSDDSHPELKARAKKAMMELVNSIRHIIEKGIERGEIRPDADSEQSATFFVTLMEGAVMMRQLSGDDALFDVSAAKVREYVDTQLRILETTP